MVNYDGMYNKEYYGDNLYKDHFYNKKLHFKIIENGTVLPHKDVIVNGKAIPWGLGGIVDSQCNFIESSFVHVTAGGAYTPTEEIQNSPETVIYFGMLYNVWGHLISDCIKMFWFFKSDSYKKYFQNCKIICTIHGGGGRRNK